MRATPPWTRMSAGTRSSAITADAPASSAIRACSALTTSQITPPLSISGKVLFTCSVPVCFCTIPRLLTSIQHWYFLPFYHIPPSTTTANRKWPTMPISSLLCYRFQPCSELLFTYLPACQGHNHPVVVLFGRDRLVAVQFQEGEHGHTGGALVAIDKWMVLAEVEAIGGGHMKNGWMEELAANLGLWHVQGRIQVRGVAQPVAAAVEANLVIVNCQYEGFG